MGLLDTSPRRMISRALAISGQYREASEISKRNVTLVTEMGRADTNAYLAYVIGMCSFLRSGGQPQRAVAYLDANTARVRHDAHNADMRTSAQGCWAVSRLDEGEPQEAEAAILEAQSKAEKGGMLYQVATMQAYAVTVALARVNLAPAEARWSPPAKFGANGNPALRRSRAACTSGAGARPDWRGRSKLFIVDRRGARAPRTGKSGIRR